MRRGHQRGAALLTAMLIVALVASLASAMVWRQYRAVQIEAADRARAQSAWILQGALDWARLILREDAAANRNEPIDHLGEIWAVPLAEARLSTFLAADRDNADDAPEAFLSGSLSDAQARYNLMNLVGGSETPALELRTLERLCESAGVSTDIATRLASQLRAAYAATPDPATAPLRPQNFEQLRWLGLGSETLERLRPLLTLLPTATPVNLNTASREVIAALFDGVDLASAQGLVQTRQSSPLRNVEEAKAKLPASTVIDAARASVSSTHFWVTGRLRLEERVLEERSLVRRQANLDMQVLSRERVNLVLEAGR